MSKAGKTVHESVHVVGKSAAEARGIVATVLAGDPEYRFVEVNAHTHQAVRSSAFLFTRRVESCTVTVVEGSTGAVVTISGRLLADRVDRIKAALASPTAEASGPPAEAPPAVSDPLGAMPAPVPQPIATAPITSPPITPAPIAPASSPPVGLVEETVHRSTPVAAGSAIPRPSAPKRYLLRFDHGEVRHLAGEVVIGRDPSEQAGGPGAERVIVADGQVSKAHATLGVDDSGAWVEDLHSTNGTYVHVHGRDPVTVTPGLRHRLEPGSVVRFGTRFVTLSRAD